ncbi:hypothetical protein TRAPUB_2894 [Trametes pubescens]|uniref:Uncharacterized protein n=1 Tax=Trametes pubescens TaxID=154538 RepID=A0A1M2VFA4_TRAPU|nr:hypothetical protein TRAPUB_2894 [Trametes pubescens]
MRTLRFSNVHIVRLDAARLASKVDGGLDKSPSGPGSEKKSGGLALAATTASNGALQHQRRRENAK